MRKFIFVLTTLTGLLTAQVIYERLFAVKSFGPSAILVTAALVTAFLGLLELLKMGDVRAAQEDLFGPIFLEYQPTTPTNEE